MKFTDLLAMFPRATPPPEIVSPQGSRISVAESILPDYVEPTIEMIHQGNNAPIVIIEATGAVGKSVLARQLSAHLHWPLVRAEQAQVGDYTLSGLIQSAFGMDSDYLARVSKGAAGVVIDALDEGHLKATTPNFLAFIRNIAAVAGPHDSQLRPPSVLLLSRLDTSELMKLQFQELGVPVTFCRLSFFDRQQANRFLELHLKTKYAETEQPEYNVALAWPKPYGKLRDARLERLMRVVTRMDSATLDANWEESEEFLGYAPVLVAIAESIAVRNPAAELESFRTEAPDGEVALLGEIVERILERERLKVQDGLKDRLTALLPVSVEGGINPESLYTAREQIARIATRTLGLQVMAPLPADLPSEIREDYERQVSVFVADHPFLREGRFASSVFSDYVSVELLLNWAVKASLAFESDRSLPKIGPFFLEFTARSLRSQDVKQIDEKLVPLLIRSWEAERDLRDDFDSSATVDLAGESGAALFPRRDSEDLRFEIVECSGALQLDHVPSRLAIVTDQGLILGRGGATLTIGEGAFIQALEIEIESTSLTVAPSESSCDHTVTIESAHLSANYLTEVQEGRSTLRIHCPSPPPKLREFAISRPEGDDVAYSDFVALRAILTAFRSTVHWGLSLEHAGMERIIGSNPIRKIILDKLFDACVVVARKDHFFLESAALSSVGFNLSDLKQGEPTESVKAFLRMCRRSLGAD